MVEIPSQIRANTPEIEGSQVKELVAIRCIADDSAADHGHKRCDSPPHALFSQALCVPDVTASQPSSEVPVRPTSPCLLLALRRQAVPSREKGALRHVSVNARSETCCDGGGCYGQHHINAAGFVRSHWYRAVDSQCLIVCRPHVVSHGLVSV